MNAPSLLDLEIWRGLALQARAAVERPTLEHLRALRRRGEQAHSTRAPHRDPEGLRACAALASLARAYTPDHAAETLALADQVEAMLDSWKTRGSAE